MTREDDIDHEAPLIESGQVEGAELNSDSFVMIHDSDMFFGLSPLHWSWRLIHAFSFLLGGTTFTAGTAILYFPALAWLAHSYDWWSAFLYTVGSCGFLAVDALELATFKSSTVLTINILCSFTGSALYILGSVGFFPSVAALYPTVGVWGFILGSFFIGCSQMWKTYRIGKGGLGSDKTFHLKTITMDLDSFTQAGVEFSAGLGAWCFFFGTLIYEQGPIEGDDSVLPTVLFTWMAGSLWFTLGGVFLAYRHTAMGV